MEPRQVDARAPRLRRSLEAALWTVGIVCGLAVVATEGDAAWFQHRAAAHLENAWHRSESLVGATRATAVAAGAPLARLSIPRLDLSAVVAEGVGDGVLRHALGHVPSSALPGSAGNVTIAGHRDTFFRPLRGIRKGDRIELESGVGTIEYRVEWSAVVDPSATVVAADAGYPALTLVTCFPFDYLGSAPYRFVVRARRVEGAGSVPRAAG